MHASTIVCLKVDIQHEYGHYHIVIAQLNVKQYYYLKNIVANFMNYISCFISILITIENKIFGLFDMGF